MADCRFMMNVKGIIGSFVPRIFFQKQLTFLFQEISTLNIKQKEYIKERVNYYNKLTANKAKNILISHNVEKIGKLPFKKTSLAYDAYAISKYFDDNFLWIKAFGDISYILDEASICKDRPICENNYNNVIMKLDKNRHFIFLKDKNNFDNKKDIAVFRGAVYQNNRKAFFEKNFLNKKCNIGHTGKDLNKWKRNFLNKQDQLQYKFLISLEGNTFASNLIWSLSSNSLVLAPKMRYETWFMEGKLIPNEHFALIDDDYENVEELIDFYINNPKKAKEIIQNAHEYLEQFFDEKKEKYISILVLAKYFYFSKQLELPQDIVDLFQ
ncbi:lipopolysaccharide biosynthesis protein [Campylobacter volucris]|uniref:glycosyl transferase family 90 n=1 Tax=Campylobacter volucris TaxID=1031542 RepID=UPI00189F294A|nr:glycosyl transferase family 90 [Campylobacter volucris]MBF7047125.1 lipopolysaccharide biosynthesis protein [Campylobacter volucris]